MSRIHSYVVRYDSGFAPNPFYGYCTLATCKPGIRRKAEVEDWVVGSGSNDRSVGRGGYLVYAMRVTEVMTFDDYTVDLDLRLRSRFVTVVESKAVATTSILGIRLRRLGSSETLSIPKMMGPSTHSTCNETPA